MEPPLKRLRLLEPDVSEQSVTYESDDYSDLYDEEDTTLDADEDDQGEDEIIEQEDPDFQLEQKRARLDLKLKSKFEAIFEKYGRDFTGIGDEIDLRTGEIVVNNGHLLEMEDERDDGTARPSLLKVFTKDAEETFGSMEAEDEESDEIHDCHVTLEDMEEDDMILFQNSGDKAGGPNTTSTRSGLAQGSLSHQHEDHRATPAPKNPYPSENEILEQFGQDLGPKIARYVSQQQVQYNSAIEPAWQTPGLPLATPGRRPILKSILLQPDNDRSPSPKGSSSVWAPKRPRGRPRRDGADIAAVFTGETIIRDRTWYSSGYVSTTVTKQRTERIDQSQSRRTMSVPLNKTLTAGNSRPELNSWVQPDSGDKYIITSMSDYEPDSSEEKLAKFYRPRRPWSNSGLTTDQGTSDSLKPQQSASRHELKNVPLVKGGRGRKVPFTPDDDEALLEWVSEAQRRGFALWSWTHWKMLAEKNPRHTHLSWQDRYRRRFWQKSAIPTLGEEDFRESLREGSHVLGAVHQIRTDPHSGSKHSPSPDESSYETLSNVSPSNFKPFRNAMSQKDPGEISRTETISPIGVLDPTLFEFPNKTEEPINPGPRQSTPSSIFQSSAGHFKIESGLHSGTLDNKPAVTSPTFSSGLQEVGFKAESPTISSQETSGRVLDADGIHGSCNLSATEGAQIASVDGTTQIHLTTDAGIAMKGENTPSAAPCFPNVNSNARHDDVAKSPGSLPSSSASGNDQLDPTIPSPTQTAAITKNAITVRLPHNSIDAAYSFSDDEDIADVETVNSGASLRYQTPKLPTHKAPPKVQKSDLPIKDFATTHQITIEQQILKNASHSGNQSPISISSSSPVSDLTEPDDVKFYLEPITPEAPASGSNMTFSGISGADDFEELCESPSATLKRTHQEMKVPEPEDRKDLLNDSRPSPAQNSTSKNKILISMTRASILKRNTKAGQSGRVIETPGGSKRCGEKGFRCGKEFCFKCMED